MADMFRVTYKNGEVEDVDEETLNSIESYITKAEPISASPAFKLPTSIPAQPESSPFGAKPPIGMDKSSGHTLKDVAYDYYGRPAIAVGEFVRDNPAKTALGVGSLLTSGMSIPVAATLAVGAEALDKFHPFNKDIRSEYESKTGADNFVDLGSAGMWGGFSQAVGNLAGGRLAKEAGEVSANQKALQDAHDMVALNAAREAENAEKVATAAKTAKEITPETVKLTPYVEKQIRKQLIEENTRLGVPKRIVTNKDVQDRHMKNIAALYEGISTPHPRELATIRPVEMPSEHIPYDIEPKGVAGNLTNAVIGAGLMSTHGLGGMALGGLAGGLLRPAADRLAPVIVKGLRQVPGPVLKATQKMSYPLAEGIVAPAVKKIRTELKKEKNAK